MTCRTGFGGGFLLLVWAWMLLRGLPTAEAKPLRLPHDEPMVCIYHHPHWWGSWKSSDEAVLNDLRRLRGMGFNTLLLDHEWSQAIDGDWRWLERSHRPAAQAGLRIMPWLSVKRLVRYPRWKPCQTGPSVVWSGDTLRSESGRQRGGASGL